MRKKLGYFSEILLSDVDANLQSWIMAAPAGKYKHDLYGEIDFNESRLNDLAASVNNKVRTTDLDIDYDHKVKTMEAAGWVKQAEVRSTGLWILVEWTKKAYELIKSKAYRYFSPEFVDEWTDPKSGQKFHNVLFGGGITNRPFLKDIAALNLHEFSEVSVMNEDQFKALLALLGLGEDATVEDAFAKIKSLEGEKEEEKEETPKEVASEVVSDPVPATLSEEDSTQIKQLKELLNGQGTLLSEMKKKLHESNVAKILSDYKVKLNAENKTISPVAEKKLSEALIAGGEENTATVMALAETLMGGVVSLGEKGSAKHTFNEDAITTFDNAITKCMSDNKEFSYADAVMHVSNTNPKLAEDYRSAIANQS